MQSSPLLPAGVQKNRLRPFGVERDLVFAGLVGLMVWAAHASVMPG